MSNALDEARSLQRESARGTVVSIRLDLLERLIAEIQTLRETAENYQAAYPNTIFRRALPHIVSKDGG